MSVYAPFGWSKKITMALAGVLLLGLFTGCASRVGSRDFNRLTAIEQAYATNSGLRAGLRLNATAVLLEMSTHEWALVRANAIEGLTFAPSPSEMMARHGLVDENVGVRFVSAMVVGQQGYTSAMPLVHELLQDPDDSVRAAAIFAMKRYGEPVDITPLALMLKNNDLRTRGNAALVLGELGDVSALRMLREAMEFRSASVTVQEQRIVQLQIAEALARLGDDSAIDRVRSMLYSRRPEDGEVTALAASILGRLGARRMTQDLRNVVAMWREYRHSAEVRLAAMGALAQLGDPPPAAWVMEYLSGPYRDDSNPVNAAIRAQALFVLGEIGTEAVVPYLAQSMESDPALLVRVQAAAVVGRLINRLDGPTMSVPIPEESGSNGE